MVERFFTDAFGNPYEHPQGQYVRYFDHDRALRAAHDDADRLLRHLKLDPERYRTEAGFLNVPKIAAALAHPDQYPRLTDSASAVQPERCCLDYPRCDCNSPPEPDNAPTLQPCGHPWKAQHDFKCILCSSPGDATYAQLAEAQRFSHSAPAGCNHFPGQVNCEWCTEPERATQPVEPKP